MTLFQNKFRIESTRLSTHDYSGLASYFITVCTHSQNPYFGEVSGGQMYLTETGIKVSQIWESTPQTFAMIELDEFIIMPDHLHAIIHIHEHNLIKENPILTNSGGITGRHNIMNMGMALGKIVRHFKSKCSYEIRLKINANFRWHPRYHDWIIRNDRQLFNFRNYIRNNPANWQHRRDLSRL